MACRVDEVIALGRVGACPTLLNLKAARGRKAMAPNEPFLVLAILGLSEVGLVGPEGVVRKVAELGLCFRGRVRPGRSP